MKVYRSSSRPSGWERIETSAQESLASPPVAVAPGLRAGRGLKLEPEEVWMTYDEVAPGLRAGAKQRGRSFLLQKELSGTDAGKIRAQSQNGRGPATHANPKANRQKPEI